MDSIFTPFFRLPLLDFGNYFVTHQDFGDCPTMEMQALNCLEAYGAMRGKEKCADLISDYKECLTAKTQIKRVRAMRLERHRQYLMGERKEHYAPPPKSGGF